jgi:hypothetical protein
MGGDAPEKPVTAALPAAYTAFGACCAVTSAGCIEISATQKAAADHRILRQAWRGIDKDFLRVLAMVAYFGAGGGGRQVPLVGSGVVPGGQHTPQEVICEGLQQAPSIVIPSLGFEQGVTHLPPRLICPAAQPGGGQALVVAPPPERRVTVPGGSGAAFVPSQRQTEMPPSVPCGC